MPASPPGTARPKRSSRSTSAFRTSTDDDGGRAAAARAQRSELDRADRAALVPVALVALDVRGRAREAVVDLPGRLRRGEPGRLPDHLPLRRRVARDERRGLARVPAPRDCDDDARPPVRAHRGRRTPRLHARGARLEHRRDPPLRAGRLQGARDPARLLHGQSRGCSDHVEGPAARRGGRLGVSIAVLAAAAALALGPQPPNAPLVFADSAHGWLGTPAGILGTSNGGRSWQKQSALGGEALEAVDARHAWAIAGQGQFLRTVNGRSWENLGVKHLAALSFVGAAQGFALERDGILLRTADGGRTWPAVPRAPLAQSLCFADPAHGWLAQGGTVS